MQSHDRSKRRFVTFHLDKNPRWCNTTKGPGPSSASSRGPETRPSRGKLVLTEFYTEPTNGGPVLQPSMKRTVRVARMYCVKKGGGRGSGARSIREASASHWPTGQSRHVSGEDDRRSSVVE